MTYVRPVRLLENRYANPVLTLASTTTLTRLDKVQNATMRLMTGGLRSTPIAALEAATGCESLALRRQGHTILARERYLRFPDNSALRTLAEKYDHAHRRLKKQSVLTEAREAEKIFKVPKERRALEVSKWSSETTPAPLYVKLDIGLPGGKSEYTHCVLKVAALDCIEQYPKDFERCYIDGSATDGTRNGVYGVKID